MRLTSRYLSEFDTRDLTLEPGTGHYAIRFDDDTFTGKDFFCDVKQSPYVVHLSDCILHPMLRLRAFNKGVLGPPPPRLLKRKWGNLVVTQGGELTCGSLTRDSQLPGGVDPVGRKEWNANLPRAVDVIDEPVVLLDLVCSHFGHALVDTTSRLWSRLEPSLEALRGLPLVGFGTHGLASDWQKWPSYLTKVLRALGVEPGDIRLIRRPTRCRSLFIPKRLSPLGSRCGYSRRYIDTMQAAGDALVGAGEPGTGRRRVYLSRSRLGESSRGLMDGQELAVEELFRRQGFEIVHPELLSLEDQIRTIREASHVAGCNGSQMHLMAFGRDAGTHMLRIAPSYHNPSTDRNIVEMGGGTFTGFVVDRDAPAGDAQGNLTSWRMTEDELTRLRDGLESWLGATPA